MRHAAASRGSAGKGAGSGTGREPDPMTPEDGRQGADIDPSGAGQAARKRPLGRFQVALVYPGPDVGLAFRCTVITVVVSWFRVALGHP